MMVVVLLVLMFEAWLFLQRACCWVHPWALFLMLSQIFARTQEVWPEQALLIDGCVGQRTPDPTVISEVKPWAVIGW